MEKRDAGFNKTISRRKMLRASLMAGSALALSPLLRSTAFAEDDLSIRRTQPRANAKADLSVRQMQIRANGISLNVVEQGSGPAVLFCHGFPDTVETWRSQMRAVAEAGYRAVALDMRGYGLSDAPADPSAYTSLQISGDLVGVLDALQLPSAVLVGHDWGAAHVWQAILKRPDRFPAAVGISVPYSPRGDVSFYDSIRQAGLGDEFYIFDFIKPGGEAQWVPAARTIPNALYWSSASPPPSERWDPFDLRKSVFRPSPVAVPSWADPAYIAHQVRSFERTGFDGGLNYYRAAPLDFDLTASFKGAVIRQPTLYVFGRADGLAQRFHPTREELRRALPGLTDYVGLDNVGHWVQHEAADRLNASLISFLRQVGAPR